MIIFCHVSIANKMHTLQITFNTLNLQKLLAGIYSTMIDPHLPIIFVTLPTSIHRVLGAI